MGKSINVDRLRNIPIQPCIKRLLSVALHHVCGNRYNWHTVELFDLAQVCRAVITINVWKVDVHQNQIRGKTLGLSKSGIASLGLEHYVPLRFKDALDQNAIL